MAIGPDHRLAVWAVTPNGLNLACRIREHWPHVVLRCSRRLAAGADPSEPPDLRPFQDLTTAVEQAFHQFDGHIFIMAAGIVVRAIASRLEHKTVDPAVVVVDDRGNHAISLLSGHIGGANALAAETAGLIGATPVITTATDVNDKPAIDMIAVRQGLHIENPEALKAVNMALITGEGLRIHDPYGLVAEALETAGPVFPPGRWASAGRSLAGVYVDDTGAPPSGRDLVLRPRSLVAGIGCNRNAPLSEIKTLLEEVCAAFRLSVDSLRAIASVDLKADEPGLLALAETLDLPLRLYTREELHQVRQVPNPSAMVAKHIGVQSVCEAAAILAAHNGPLVVPKHKSANVTAAIARHRSMSSASGREA